MQYFRKNDYNPDLFHPYYIIRKNLFKKVSEYSSYMKGDLLDFGCGSKPYKSLFKVDCYTGLDFENEGHSHDFEEIDVIYNGKEIPFPDRRFDSVLSTEVFEHIFNLPEVLKEINRVMKPGAHLIITCPFVWNEHEVPYDYARYTLFAIKDMTEKCGFEIVHQQKSGNFILALSQLWVLYFYQNFYGKIRRFFLTRWLFTFFFIFLPNICGSFFNMLLPKNDTLYLNNVVVLRKKIS